MKLVQIILKNSIKIAGIIIIAGLIIKAFTIIFIQPIPFLIDLGISTILIFAGIIIYLVSFFSTQSSAE